MVVSGGVPILSRRSRSVLALFASDAHTYGGSPPSVKAGSSGFLRSCARRRTPRCSSSAPRLSATLRPRWCVTPDAGRVGRRLKGEPAEHGSYSPPRRETSASDFGRLLSAQPRRCPAFRRRSLDHPIRRLSPLCDASQWFGELTMYPWQAASRRSASWMEATQRRISDKIALGCVGPRRRLACSTLRFCSLPLPRHRAGARRLTGRVGGPADWCCSQPVLPFLCRFRSFCAECPFCAKPPPAKSLQTISSAAVEAAVAQQSPACLRPGRGRPRMLAERQPARTLRCGMNGEGNR